jgi:hypothetical protein
MLKMISVEAGLMRDQAHPRMLFLYRDLSSRWARL